MNGTESDAISSKSRLHPESTLRRIGNLTSEERTLLLGYLWAQIDQDVLVRALDRMDEKLKP